MSMRLQKRKQCSVHFAPNNLSALWNILFGSAAMTFYLEQPMFSKYRLPGYEHVNLASWNYIDYCT